MSFMHEPPTADDAFENMRLLERALDYLSQDNINFARLILKQRMQRFGEDAEGLAHLAMTYAHEEDHDHALKTYRRALDAAEADVLDLDDSDDWWEHLEARPYLRCLYGIALSLLEQGCFEESLRTLQRMLKLSPSDPMGARQMVGIIHHRRGDLDEAIECYRSQIHDPMICYNLALALYQQGDIKQAVLTLRQALLSNQYVPSAMFEKLPEPFDYPYQRGSEEPEYAWAYAGTCGDLWDRADGAVALMKALTETQTVQDEGEQFRDLAGRLARERRRADKEKLQNAIDHLRSLRRLQRTNPVVLNELKHVLPVLRERSA
jgi:tetratricopeptide (TPR) repeat protein